MKKNILIVSLFGEINNANSRLHKIAHTFSEKVSIVTPDFCHAEKKYKSKKTLVEKNPFFVKYIHVPSYNKNLTYKRSYSHLVFTYKLRLYLNNLVVKPDFILCLMPPSSSAYVCGLYCKKENIDFVIDIIDLWPDSLIPLTRYKSITNFLLYPWRLMTEKTYKMATYISGQSKAYALAAHKINPKVPYSYTYLGVNQDKTKQLVNKSKIKFSKPANEIWICYGGSLGNSYDFKLLLKAIKHIDDEKIKYRMYFVGEGEKRSFIEKFTADNALNIEITGRLAYKDYLKYLSVCDIGINNFKKGSLVAYSFKFNDYVASNLFILNNLLGETSEMVDRYKIGLNFDEDNLTEMLYQVCRNWHTYDTHKINMELLIEKELDSTSIYKKLIKNILVSSK
jgi:glycosyltransferase involved in cell wall biosynthesis